MITRERYNELRDKFAEAEESIEDDTSIDNMVNQGVILEEIIKELFCAVELHII